MQKQQRMALFTNWICGILAGLLAGIVLGFTLKVMQYWSGKQIYTLLLNIDFIVFIPVLSEMNEFILHLLVSVVLGVVYRMAVVSFGHPLYISLFMSLMAAMLWIPLTLISERVPEVDDYAALVLWFAGHLVFGFILYAVAGRKNCMIRLKRN
ncbi:hypothetical protein [Paenibacillus sp. GCM10027626]|uniref:hypothetical protein n=1 Tax=Paenibacillus sp. GCM10027626 TaxID=3273411 RepID=UPI00363D1846